MKNISIYLFLVVLFLFASPDIIAQCPMCRMSAESNLAHGGTEGKGLNTGILYLLSLPYLMVGVLAFVWWKRRTKERVE